MKRKLYYVLKTTLLSLLCIAVAGCAPEDLDVEGNRVVDGTVELILKASSGLSTRTTLSGSEPMQHVREVHLYVFDGTADNAICVASEDVEWLEKATEAGLGDEEQLYTVKYKGFIENTTYTFIVVGLDDRSGATYGLPDAVAVGRTTLGQTIAALAAGKGREDISKSELFGGSSELTIEDFDGSLVHPVEIELYRRVAGVMGWFNNIPQEIDGRAVAHIRIELYKAQNQSIYLKEKLASDPALFADYIMNPIGNLERDSSRLLVDIELTPDDFLPTAVVSKGSYVLPIIAPFADETAMAAAGYDDQNIYVKDYTMRIVLTDAEGTELRIKRVKDYDGELGGTGTSIDAYRFHIRADFFYSIGNANNPISLLEENGEEPPEDAVMTMGSWQKDVDIEM